LKPANLIVTSQEDIVIIDFGLAKVLEDDLHLTVVGTQGYRPPEQRKSRYDHRVDLFAAGIIFYEMLDGKRPWFSDDSTLEHPAPELPYLDKGWNMFVQKALATSPEDRFQSVQEMRKELRRLAKSDGTTLIL